MGAKNTTLHRESVSKHWAVSKKILGKGSFATVRKATKKKTNDPERKLVQDSFPDIVAVKIVEKSKARDEEELALFQDEVEIMHRIDHQNCVRLVSRPARCVRERSRRGSWI